MNWQVSSLGAECELYQPQTLAKNELDNSGLYKVYGANGVIGTHSKFNHEESQLLITCRGATCGTINVSEPKSWINGNAMVVRPKTANLDLQFLKHYLSFLNIDIAITGAAQPQITRQSLSPIKIKFPPLAEQKRIAAILNKAIEIKAKRELAIAKLDGFIASLFNAIQLAENFEATSTIKDLTKKTSPSPIADKSVWSLSLEQIDANTGNINDCVMVDRSKLGSSTYFFSPPVVLYSKLRPYLNKVALPKSNGFATTELVPLYCDEKKVLPEYLATYLRSSKFVEFANTNSAGAKMPRVMMDKFWGHHISLPNIAEQLKFVTAYKQCKKQMQVHEESAKTLGKLIASLQHQAFTTGFNA